jgi:hypothetical protein
MVAFGGVGMLALLRVGLTGWAVARGTGRPPAMPMLFVASVWIATRLASGWTFDLARGLSPAR